MRRILALAAASALAAGGLLLGATPASAAVCGPPALPDPTTTIIEAAAGTTVFFPIPGLCLAPGGTILSSNPPGATVTTLADGTPSAGVTVVPANANAQVIPVTVTVDQGDSTTRNYSLAAYLGVSSTIVWPPAAVPTQVAIDQGGEGSFTLPGLYWPRYSECEIKVSTSPDARDFYTAPPNPATGEVQVGMTSSSDFVGKIVVTYGLACTPPGGVKSGATYTVELYVGIPIPPPTPVLAATGSERGTGTAVALAGAAMIAAGGMLALGTSRRRRASR